MTTANIFLVRHGQDLDNANGILNGHRDMQLTEKGVFQAEELATKIAENGIRFDKVYSSPLCRAFQTASIITTRLDMEPPETLELLIERDFGCMSGKPAREIETLCSPKIMKTSGITYFLSPEGAETFPDLVIRAGKLLESIRIKHPKESLLLVTHGDFGKMLYAAFYRLGWEEVLNSFHFGNSEMMLLKENCPPNQRKVFSIRQYNL
jgi:broad specificity phosphatase PhoE